MFLIWGLAILTVKMLRLLHEKLGALLPLAFQQLFQALRYGHVAIDAAAAKHGLQRIRRRRCTARSSSRGVGITLRK